MLYLHDQSLIILPFVTDANLSPVTGLTTVAFKLYQLGNTTSIATNSTSGCGFSEIGSGFYKATVAASNFTNYTNQTLVAVVYETTVTGFQASDVFCIYSNFISNQFDAKLLNLKQLGTDPAMTPTTGVISFSTVIYKSFQPTGTLVEKLANTVVHFRQAYPVTVNGVNTTWWDSTRDADYTSATTDSLGNLSVNLAIGVSSNLGYYAAYYIDEVGFQSIFFIRWNIVNNRWDISPLSTALLGVSTYGF